PALLGQLLLRQVPAQADRPAPARAEVALEPPALPQRGEVAEEQMRLLPADDARVGAEHALQPGGAAALGADDEHRRVVEETHLQHPCRLEGPAACGFAGPANPQVATATCFPSLAPCAPRTP